jgi:hypothetical protein
MKRSTQVSLVLMTAAGVGGAAYALTPSNSCRQPAPSAVTNDTAQDCRSSRSGSGGHGSYFSFYSGSSGSRTSTSTTSIATSSTSTSSRGGFGGIGHALSGGG